MITTREIVDRLKDIYDKLAAAVSFRWGVVVSTTPPLVRLDADTDPVIVGTIAPLTVGSRVLVLLQNRKNTVIGSAGGAQVRSALAGTTVRSITAGTGELTVDLGLPSTPSGWSVLVTNGDFGVQPGLWIYGSTQAGSGVKIRYGGAGAAIARFDWVAVQRG